VATQLVCCTDAEVASMDGDHDAAGAWQIHGASGDAGYFQLFLQLTMFLVEYMCCLNSESIDQPHCCVQHCRSHLSNSNWKVWRPTTASECGLHVLGPRCEYPGTLPQTPSDTRTSVKVVCDTSSVPTGSMWLIVPLTADPVLRTANVPATVCVKAPNQQQ
jgi:hypothetical protein